MLGEINRLKRMRWVDLEGVALREANMTVAEVQGCATLDELRLAILKAKTNGEEPVNA